MTGVSVTRRRIDMNTRGLRGLSAADIARATGQVPADTTDEDFYDALAASLAETNTAILYRGAMQLSMLSGMHPTANRPVVFCKITETMAFIDVYPNDAMYRGGLKRRMGDKVRYWMIDAGPWMGITRNWCVAGKSASFGGREQPILTSLYNEKVGSSTSDTGQQPTANRPPVTLGVFGSTVNSTNYKAVGDWHGFKAYINQVIFGTLNDVSTGFVDVTTNLLDLPIGVPWQGNSILIDSSFNALTAGGFIAARVNEADIFGSDANYCWYASAVWNFGHGDVNCTPGVSTMNVAVGATSEMDTVVGIVNGVAGTVRNVLNRDSSTVNLGNAEKVVMWDSGNPNVKDETLIGVDYNQAYRINDDYLPLDSGVPLQDRTDPGPKWGAQSEGSGADATNYAGKTLATFQRHTVAFDPEDYA